jgi:hypothetical protein
MISKIHLAFLSIILTLALILIMTKNAKNFQTVRVENVKFGDEFRTTVYRADLYDLETNELVCENCKIPSTKIVEMVSSNKNIAEIDIVKHEHTQYLALSIFLILLIWLAFFGINKITE